MRTLRLLLFFCVGLALGGGAVAAFAAPADYGRSVNINSPSGGGTARPPGWYGQPRYDFPDAPDGWGKLRDINTLEIGGKRVEVEGIRKFSPGTLARIGSGLAKSLGPLGLGITIAELVWDESQGWLFDPPPTETVNQPRDYQDGAYWLAGWPGSWLTPRAACLAMRPNQPTTGVYWWNSSSEFACQRESGYSPLNWGRGPRMTCPEGSTDLGDGNCRVAGEDPEPRPASDSELEDAIYTELVARGMGSDLARRLVDAGYTLTPDGHEAVGPTSVPGQTTTTSTTGPAGTTTTTSTTTHNLTYNTNVTTNTTTVTVTNVTTHTTTAPDGTTTTTTETTTPAEGQQEEEPQYTLDYEGSTMPEVPDFYEQRYPDGFAGEWDGFKDKIAASSVAGLLAGFTNGLPGGGTCPEWSVSLNFGAMGNLGTHVIAPPCAVWPFVKAIMILSALFVARRMVFGG